jgi:hypothetical protein
VSRSFIVAFSAINCTVMLLGRSIGIADHLLSSSQLLLYKPDCVMIDHEAELSFSPSAIWLFWACITSRGWLALTGLCNGGSPGVNGQPYANPSFCG